MEPDRIAVPFEDDDLGIIEEPLARDPAEMRRGAYERAPQRVDREIEDELGPESPRVREDHEEDPESPHSTRHWDLRDVGPVDLCLLAR